MNIHRQFGQITIFSIGDSSNYKLPLPYPLFYYVNLYQFTYFKSLTYQRLQNKSVNCFVFFLEYVSASTSSSSSSTKNRKALKGQLKKNSESKTETILLNDENVGIAKYDTKAIVACLVNLLKPTNSLSFEAKGTILKLCARLTRNYENAASFLRVGGVSILLNMTYSCSLIGFPTYAIIILRHIIEAPLVLQESMERLLTMRTTLPIPVGQRDLIYLLTQVSSSVARNPETFINAAKRALRIDDLNSQKMLWEDSRFLVKSNLNLKSKLNNSPPKSPEDDISTSITLIRELLYAIAQPCVHFSIYTAEHTANAAANSQADVSLLTLVGWYGVKKSKTAS